MTTQMNKRVSLFAGLIASIMLLLTSCTTGPSNQATTASSPTASPTPSPAASPSPSPSPCDDTAMNASVKAALARVPGLKPRRVNYFSTSCVVTLQGYVNSPGMYVKAIEEVQQITGVKGINVYHLRVKADPTTLTDECEDRCDTNTQKPCGDICIPKNDPCNIEGPVCTISSLSGTAKPSPSSP
jgi:BON domain